MWTMMAILVAFYVGFFTASALGGARRRAGRAYRRQVETGRVVSPSSAPDVPCDTESTRISTTMAMSATRN